VIGNRDFETETGKVWRKEGRIIPYAVMRSLQLTYVKNVRRPRGGKN